MNICFFSYDFSETAVTGGTERSSSLLAEELRRRGHRVEFYLFKLRQSKPHFHIPFVSFLFSSLWPASSDMARSEGRRFLEFVKEHKIDVAVWQKMGFIVPFPFKNLPCRLVAVHRNTPKISKEVYTDQIIRGLNLRSRLAQWLVQRRLCRFLLWKFYTYCFYRFSLYACRYGDKFVLLSEHFIPEFAPAKKFPHKVCAISNIAPLAVEDVDFTTKKKELLWVGRVRFTQKRPDFMLHVWCKLQDRFPDWSLRFVGEGDYLPEAKALAKDLGVQRVFFEGYQNPIPYYRSAPIYCMTSTFEGFGLTLVEAQAYGCVPIAFDSFSAVHDIIENGTNGVLVPSFDLDIYAEKLAELMSNSELRERLARNAQESVTKFSAKVCGDKWEKLLQEFSR